MEHNLAKVGVEGSNPFARSNNLLCFEELFTKKPSASAGGFCLGVHLGSTQVAKQLGNECDIGCSAA